MSDIEAALSQLTQDSYVVVQKPSSTVLFICAEVIGNTSADNLISLPLTFDMTISQFVG